MLELGRFIYCPLPILLDPVKTHEKMLGKMLEKLVGNKNAKISVLEATKKTLDHEIGHS